jgi:hypothetical protein
MSSLYSIINKCQQKENPCEGAISQGLVNADSKVSS